MSEWVDVIALDEMSSDARATVLVDGIPVVVFIVEGQAFALEDECSHECYPLVNGSVEGDRVTCAQHGAQFSLRTGEVLAPPAYEPVATYPARVRDGRVQVNRKRREA